MSLFGLFEKRSLNNPQVPLSDPGLAMLWGGPPTESGIAVNEFSAMNFSAVARCVNLISGLGGAMPIVVSRTDTKEPVKSNLVTDPHPEMTGLEFWRISYVHRLLWGNFYAQKVRKGSGALQYLIPMFPSRVLPKQLDPTPTNPSGKVFQVTDVDGKTHEWTSREVFHLPGVGFDGLMGASPVRMASQAIGLSLGAEAYAAKLFGSGNLTTGILSTDQPLNDQQARDLKARWREVTAGLRNAHDAPVLDRGLKFQSLAMPNDDSQLLESRRFELTEIGRWYGVPPFLLFDHEKSTTWGSGLEQQALGFVKFDLHPTWLAPTERRITKELLGDGLQARYDMTELLRGDSIARAEFYRVLYGIGSLNPDEIRAGENLPPIPGGDVYLKPATIIADEGKPPIDPEGVVGGSSMGPSHKGT